MLEINAGVCQGRHEIPVNDYFFGMEVNPLDVEGLTSIATEKLDELFGGKGGQLNLHVTGLTVATVAILNACRDAGVGVTLYHYDRNSGTYYPQAVK